jgi:carbon storage regulator
MLVLSRFKGEVIDIGDDIEVTIVDIDAKLGRVKLGINAPRSVAVHRREVTERISAVGAERAQVPEHNPDRVSRPAGN